MKRLAAAGRVRRAVAALAPADRREAARILAVAVVVEIGLRTITLPRLAWLLRIRVSFDASPPGAPPADDLEPGVLPGWASKRLDLVRSVLRAGPAGPTCLRVSLVAAQRLGPLSPTVRIGVRRHDGAFEAHAWLEVGGRALDPAAGSFSPMTGAPG